MISWPRDDVHAPFCQHGCTTCHLSRGDPECKLQRQRSYRQRRVIEPPAVFRECEQVGADTKLEPPRAELPMERKSKGSAVELAHGGHLPREDDRVVDAANGELWIHASLLIRSLRARGRASCEQAQSGNRRCRMCKRQAEQP